MSDLIKLNQNQLEKLIHLLHNPDELLEVEPKLKDKLELLAFVDSQIRRYPRMRDAAKVIMEHKPRPDSPAISKTYAYQLIREAQYVYASVSVYEKKYYKSILIEKALQVLEYTQRHNKIKEFNLTMASLIKLFGFDNNEDTAINAEMLQQHKVMVVVNFRNSSDSYNIDISKLHLMPLAERMNLIREVEAENIDFDMISKIKSEEEQDAE